ncbi:TPA: hypothetical protein QCX08_004021 [Bacillus cytotoxicus]|nr:hypothetical protein [Bacillus cytotoxicus]HDR7866143.1 hypothetical protein [Bacillus cytotoxicus]HDR7881799.1 hypothetical protein [Bacillus cytotoxicus]
MFVRQRVYYDRKTGVVITTTGNYEDGGLLQEPTVEDDLKTYSALVEREAHTIGVIQLEKGQYQDEFAKCKSFRVDVNKKEILFDLSTDDKNEIEEKKTIEHRVSMIEATLNDMLIGGM